MPSAPRSPKQSTTKPLPSASELAPVLSAEEQLAGRARRLVADLIAHAEWVMATGNDLEKSRMTQSALPALTRALATAEEGKALAEMRAKYDELRVMIRDAKPSDYDARARVAAVRDRYRKPADAPA